MPTAPSRPCRHPLCSRFAIPDGHGFCDAHAPAAKAAVAARRVLEDDRRGTAASRGYGSRWRDESRAFRKLFPVCNGYLTPTNEWSAPAALEFHARRMVAAKAGKFLTFYLRELLPFLEEHPIYLWHPNEEARVSQLRILGDSTTSGIKLPSEVVDHIIPHRGDMELFWATWNWQCVTKAAHDEKTAKFDGGFRGSRAAPTPAATKTRTPFIGGIA